jgi:hypothetical protein
MLAVLSALLGVPVAGAQSELMPGVTYERNVEYVNGKRVVVHVVSAPQPGGLYRLAPVLSNDTVLGREAVTGMQDRLASQATMVGINADYFNFEDGHPSGMFMTGGVLLARPVTARSTLGIDPNGLLRIARVGFFGTWAIGDMVRQALDQLNRPLEKGEVGLFTPAWGESTPSGRNVVDIAIGGFTSGAPNVDLAGTVLSVSEEGGTSIPADGAVLQATGEAAVGLAALAQPGAPFVVKLILKPWWDDVTEAIGGGPALVRHGSLALPTTEAFTSSQLLPRDPRSAVGQLADGRLLFVAVDGRQKGSAGMTNRDLAQELKRLGAVTAFALDSGGSTTLAFDGNVLNSPSDGQERPVADALMLMYYGAYAAAPRFAVVSPNGDGVAEQQQLSWKIVRPSEAKVRLVGRDGQVAWQQGGPTAAGTYPVPSDVLSALAEGQWRFVVSATDDQGLASKAERTFSVNTTLGFISLSAKTLALSRSREASLGIRFTLAHSAKIQVVVLAGDGQVVRTVFGTAAHKAGDVSVTWNGRNGRGKLVASGRYRIQVTATNDIGSMDLNASVVVHRRR